MKLQYSREELLEIAKLPICKTKPQGLYTPPKRNYRSEFGTSNKSRHVWPVISNYSQRYSSYSVQSGMEPDKYYSRGYNSQQRYVKSDYDPYVLGPQRQSFGNGCSVKLNRSPEQLTKNNFKNRSKVSTYKNDDMDTTLLGHSRDMKYSPSKGFQKRLNFSEKSSELQVKNSCKTLNIPELKNGTSIIKENDKSGKEILRNVGATATCDEKNKIEVQKMTDKGCNSVQTSEKINTGIGNINKVKKPEESKSTESLISHSLTDNAIQYTDETKNDMEIHSIGSSHKKQHDIKIEKPDHIQNFLFSPLPRSLSVEVNGSTLAFGCSTNKNNVNDLKEKSSEIKVTQDLLNSGVPNNNSNNNENSNSRRVQFCDTVKEIDPTLKQVIITKDLKYESKHEAIQQSSGSTDNKEPDKHSSPMMSWSLPINKRTTDNEMKTSTNESSKILSQLPYDLRTMVVNAKPSSEMFQRMEAKAMIDGLRSGKMTIDNIMCQLQNSALQPRHRDLLACILKMHLEKELPTLTSEDLTNEVEKLSLAGGTINQGNASGRAQPTWDLAEFQEHLSRKKKNRLYTRQFPTELTWPPPHNRWSFPINYTPKFPSENSFYVNPGQPTPPRISPNRMVPIDMAQLLRQQLWFPQQHSSPLENEFQRKINS